MYVALITCICTFLFAPFLYLWFLAEEKSFLDWNALEIVNTEYKNEKGKGKEKKTEMNFGLTDTQYSCGEWEWQTPADLKWIYQIHNTVKRGTVEKSV